VIPTARYVHHVGIPVPDLNQAVAFFTDVLGGELLYATSTWSDADGDWMTHHFDVPPRAQLRTVMLRLGATTHVELLAWSGDSPAGGDAASSPGIGTAHLAIFVDDLEQAAAYLAAEPGVRVLGERTVVTGEPNEGTEFLFVRLPWGLSIELMRHPALMPYCAPQMGD
jgi:catechol 2,3-dioxygenase-like lactoylglutathione lyase family enzyme